MLKAKWFFAEFAVILLRVLKPLEETTQTWWNRTRSKILIYQSWWMYFMLPEHLHGWKSGWAAVLSRRQTRQMAAACSFGCGDEDRVRFKVAEEEASGWLFWSDEFCIFYFQQNDWVWSCLLGKNLSRYASCLIPKSATKWHQSKIVKPYRIQDWLYNLAKWPKWWTMSLFGATRNHRGCNQSSGYAAQSRQKIWTWISQNQI